VLLDCVQWKLPKLWRHMQNLGMVEMNMFENATYPWFLSLFTASLPLEPMLRAWDCFFHEGIKVRTLKKKESKTCINISQVRTKTNQDMQQNAGKICCSRSNRTCV